MLRTSILTKYQNHCAGKKANIGLVNDVQISLWDLDKDHPQPPNNASQA